MAKLDVGRKHLGARANGPRDDGLLDLARLDGFDDAVLLDAANLAEEDEELAVGVGLVAQEVVDEGRARVAVTADGDALVRAVGRVGEDVVELVRHAARLGDVADRPGAVQLGREDVVDHAARVADAEAAGLDAANRRRANDDDLLLLGGVEDLARVALRDALGNEGDGLDLRELERLERRLVDRARRRKVDDDVGVGALGDGLLHRLEHGEERLLGAPVELLDVVPAEGVDHGGDRRDLATARKVKVEHALDRTRLETVDDRARVLVKGAVPRAALGRVNLVLEVDNVVLGLLALARLRSAGSGLDACVGDEG